MAESSDFSELTGGQGCAERGSHEETTATLEEVPHAPTSERSLASGFDHEGIDVDQSHATPSTSSYSLRNRNKSKLIYDAKYHPMDDTIRPVQAAKRREAHGEEQVCLDSDNSSEASTVHTDAEESEDKYSEAEDGSKQPAKGKKRGLARSWPVLEPTRRSPRNVSDPKVSYNMSIHPQDEFLVLSSDEEELKTKKKVGISKHVQVKKPVSDNEAATSKSGKRKYVDYVENSTSDELDSDDEHDFSSVEADADAPAATESSPTSPVAGHPQEGTQYDGVMDTDSMYSGETCAHDEEDAWPAQLGQPFNVFIENLSDQLASEAHAFSPLEYNDDGKENTTGNNEMDSDPLPTYEGISVIPEAEYTETSEEREMSSHRALVSHALYDEPAPQTYGLNGAHLNSEASLLSSEVGTNEFFFEAIKILRSGTHLPM